MRVFDPTRFAVVETTGRNLLLRGNIPLSSTNQLAYDAMSQAARAAGVDLAAYDLLDVCLTDNVGERYMWAPEMTAFGIDPAKYPETFWPPWQQPNWVYGAELGNGMVRTSSGWRHGNVVWWPIEAPCGAPVGPFLDAPGWNLNGLVDALQQWLHHPTPLAIYVHCTLGADRTGAAIGSYLIKTQGLTGPEAIDAVTRGTLAKVAPSPAYQQLILDYAAQPT